MQTVSAEAHEMYDTALAGLTYWCPDMNIYHDPRYVNRGRHSNQLGLENSSRIDYIKFERKSTGQ